MPRSGLDARRLAGVVDLAAQTRDQDVDRVRHRLLALAPGLLEDLLAGDDRASVPQECLQDRKLPSREDELLRSLPGRPVHGVESQVAARKLLRGAALVAAEQCPRPGREHFEIEGLAEVVVGSLGEALDGRRGVVHCRQHEDRLSEALEAGAAANVEPVPVGQAPVEDEQVVSVQAHQLIGLLDRRGFVAREPGARQRAHDQGAQP